MTAEKGWRGVKRWNIDAPCNNQYEEHPEGEWVQFEDHERELVAVELNLKRCQDEGADIWGELARRTGLELDAHKAMSEKVIMQLAASMQAFASERDSLLNANRNLGAECDRLRADLTRRLSEAAVLRGEVEHLRRLLGGNK